MTNYFHGAGRRGPYFEGWYLKHQGPQGDSLALIPALHIDGAGQRRASLQVITDREAWWLDYPAQSLRALRREFHVQLGQNRFTSGGIQLDIQREGLSLHGAVRYGPLTPLRSDIMGPFRFFSGMECAHGVLSMGHTLEGELVCNGRPLPLSGGLGYLETDRGRSFPSAYLWSQCMWREGGFSSLMLAIAAIPLPVGSFTGCICSILHSGREYRLATYLGARVERWSAAGALIRQGRYRLAVELLEERSQTLRAPAAGKMERTIRESLSAPLRYRFWRDGVLLLDRVDSRGSFEYADAGH